MARLPTLLAAAPALLSFLLRTTTATPLFSITPRDSGEVEFNETGLPRCYTGNTCPGLWPHVDSSTPPSLNTTLFTAVNDAGLLASAALKAIPAAHFDYFFDRTPVITKFLTTVFTNIADCTAGKTCKFSQVFPDNNPDRGYGWCKNAPVVYSYATSTTQTAAEGGGVVYMCPKGLELPRNPVPCTTNGDPTVSLGFALLRALVQSPAIIDPDNSGVLFDGLPVQPTGNSADPITENKNPGDWDLADMGWGDSGNGLRAKGVGNAANWAYFASLSWDLGYGPAPTWKGEDCQNRWTNFAADEGLVPIS
ncbi:hypothetical protein G7Y79_00072g097720 [Physcia stellaris]|nr:hypothetical protein G7Y79_00072g097720 [Physcia stellaris]